MITPRKKRIVQVFKPADAWMQQPPGLGDFVRGICHLFELTERLGMELRIDVSQSDLAAYLEYDEAIFVRSDPSDIRGALEHPFSQSEALMSIMDFMISDRDTLYISSNLGEPGRLSLPAATQAFARRFYAFTPDVSAANAWAPLKFSVLSVRCGDSFFGNDQKRLPKLQRAALHHLIEQHITNRSGPVIVMSDSKHTKDELARSYGFLAVPTSPSHGARGNALPMLMDLDLLTRSSHNYHINLWAGWWSGFSHYTSLIFRIPDTNIVGPAAIGTREVARFIAGHPFRYLVA